MTDFTPTDEQRVALDKFATGRSLAIEAGAGAGKTSTLTLLAGSTRKRGQYVAFNKAIVTEAGSKMPDTVTCSTAHALAFRSYGRRFAHRLNSPRIKSSELARMLRLEAITVTRQDGERKRISASFLASLTMRAIENFCQSADPEPTDRHVPYINGIDVPPGEYANNNLVARQIVPVMKRAWADLTNTAGTLPYRHSHYLKAWQLSGPRIGADFILFDEAQDANPVMLAIVAAQTHAQLVFVGDSQQQIYSFTGAVNALANVPADDRAFLTQSFRFGPAIADVANRVLDALDAELRIQGTDSIPSIVEEIEEPDAILTRTNATAVRCVLEALSAGRRPFLVGGGTEIVAFAKAARDLMTQGWTSHPELACFNSWNEVREYVEQDEQGADLALLVKLVDEFSVETILEALDRMPREADADVVVSTAHKSKGREWNRVKLAGDFPETATGEELRLLYVAVTRARLSLDLSAVAYFTLAAAEAVVEPEVVEPDAADEIADEIEADAETFVLWADGIRLGEHRSKADAIAAMRRIAEKFEVVTVTTLSGLGVEQIVSEGDLVEIS